MILARDRTLSCAGRAVGVRKIRQDFKLLAAAEWHSIVVSEIYCYASDLESHGELLLSKNFVQQTSSTIYTDSPIATMPPRALAAASASIFSCQYTFC